MIKYAQGEKNQFDFVKTSFLTRKCKKITRHYKRKRHWRGANRRQRGSKGQCGGVKDDEEALKCDWCAKRCVKRHLKAARKR